MKVVCYIVAIVALLNTGSYAYSSKSSRLQCKKSACKKSYFYSTRYKKCYRNTGKAEFRKPRCQRAWLLDKEKGICIRKSCTAKEKKNKSKNNKNTKQAKFSSNTINTSKDQPNLKVIEWRGVSQASACKQNAKLGYVEIVIKNTGKSMAKSGWSVQFYNQSRPSWIKNVKVNKILKPGDTFKVVGEIKIRNKKYVRNNVSYTFYPYLDFNNQIAESNEQDNNSGDPMTLYRPKSCG